MPYPIADARYARPVTAKLPPLLAALPALLFVLVVGVDLSGLLLERALLATQLTQACQHARSANEATPPAFDAPELDLDALLPEGTELLLFPQDPSLVCQAQRPVDGLVGLVVHPHTLRLEHRLPMALE